MAAHRTSPKNPALDGWRGLAIWGVWFGHFDGPIAAMFRPWVGESAAHWMQVFLYKARVGVLYFFCLSGYLVARSFLRDSRPNGVRIPAFFLRRARRILPGLAVFLAALFVLDAFDYVDVPLASIAASALFVRNWTGLDLFTGHLWSLSVEEQFYLLCPVLLIAASRARRPFLWVGALTVAAIAWREWGGAIDFKPLLGLRSDAYSTDVVLCFLLGGVALCFLPERSRPIFAHPATLLILLGLNFAILDAHFPAGRLLLPLLSVGLLACLIHQDNPAARLFQFRWLLFLGTISYSLYLWQQLFMRPVSSNLVVNLTLSLLVSLASYHWIERPFLEDARAAWRGVVRYSGWGVIGGLVLLRLWKNHFGIDLYDEPFYVVSGFKSFALGDIPFTDEVLGGLRHADLFNHFLVRPWAPFSLLVLRHLATLLHASLLILLLSTCFQRRGSLLFGLAFAVAFTPNILWAPSWSYNAWVSNLLLLQALFLFWSAKSGKPLAAACAGACFALAILSYQTLALCLVPLLVLMIWRRKGIAYCVGGLAVAAAYVGGIASLHWEQGWWDAGVKMLALKDSLGSPSFWKATGVLRSLMGRIEFWWVLSLMVLRRMSPRIVGVISVPFLVAIVWNFSRKGEASYLLYSLSTALGLCGAAYLIWDSLKAPRFEALVFGLTTLSVGFVMGVSSWAGMVSLLWVLPILAIPLFARADAGPRVPKLSAVLHLLGGLLLVAQVSSALTRTYGDASPSACTTELKAPPLQGIKTTPSRARALEELAAVTERHGFAVTLGAMPITFLFGTVRSSFDSSYTLLGSPDWIQKEALIKLLRNGRFPEVIVVKKQSGWEWGASPNSSVPWIPGKSPYETFAVCIKKEVLHQSAEFDAFSVDPVSIPSCVKQVIDSV